jgi:O-antigen/teichoic acid export membrane protein
MGERNKQYIKGSASDDLLKHTSILFSGMIVVHTCNMVYQMAVSRMLPREEYVLLTAFLGVLAIIARPLSTLTTGISHYSSLLRQDGRIGDIKRLLMKWLVLTGIPAVILGSFSVIFNQPLTGFLHIDRVAPVVIAGAVLPALFWLPILNGAGQGLQLFGWVSAATIFSALVRLGLGAGLVWLIYPACGWAMLGHGLGLYASAGLLLLGLILKLRGKARSTAALPSMRFYLLQSFFIQAAYAVLMTADVVLVKHYLPEDTEFAYAATLGRMVVFLPGAIAIAMFPKVASRGGTTAEQRSIFFRSFGFTVLFVGIAIIGCFLISGLLSRILFGIADASVYLKQMIGMMALVMGFSALLNVVVQFLMAQRRFVPAFATIGFAAVYLLGAVFFHATAWQIVILAGVCNTGALLVGIFFVVRLWPRGADRNLEKA